jgi:hypothetical protein
MPVKKKGGGEFKRKEIVLKDSRTVTIGIRRNGEKIIWIKGKMRNKKKRREQSPLCHDVETKNK